MDQKLLFAEQVVPPSTPSSFLEKLKFKVGKYIVGIGTERGISEDAKMRFMNDLKDDVDNEKADIYQVTSIIRSTRFNEFEVAEVCPAYYSFLITKCLLCALIQTALTPLVAVTQLTKFLDTADEICKWNPDFYNVVGKLLATSFSAYIWILFATAQRNNNDPSNAATNLILKENKICTEIDGVVYIWGYCCNITSQFATSLSAVIFIFTAEDALDVILNSLAIFFVNELDDVLVSSIEYFRAAYLLKHVEDNEVDSFMESGEELRDIHFSFVPFKFFGIFGSVVTFCILSVAPFFMFACYGVAQEKD
eukprot:CAMPEP_0172484600 /NCGR_PEP_ID=MMETSP1066-20121228/12125_1 /TAXON_ID=671091 /ORGANISM="Coscinodiscus wailesii, Strain CCMP2513" /LENGTH=307 /DNA_ID=CAMNT_0013249229 /DNA_START=90 /DNA_END=1013 /DNA_ORIENTATION=+